MMSLLLLATSANAHGPSQHGGYGPGNGNGYHQGGNGGHYQTYRPGYSLRQQYYGTGYYPTYNGMYYGTPAGTMTPSIYPYYYVPVQGWSPYGYLYQAY